MKKILQGVILSALMLALTAEESRNSPSAMLDNFAEMDGVVSITIPPFVLKWGLGIARTFGGQINTGGADSLLPPGLLKSAEALRVTTADGAEVSKEIQNAFDKFIEKSDFSEFVRSNEKGERASIYIQMDENNARLLVYAREANDFSLVYLKAKIDADSFMEFMAQGYWMGHFLKLGCTRPKMANFIFSKLSFPASDDFLWSGNLLIPKQPCFLSGSGNLPRLMIWILSINAIRIWISILNTTSVIFHRLFANKQLLQEEFNYELSLYS